MQLVTSEAVLQAVPLHGEGAGLLDCILATLYFAVTECQLWPPKIYSICSSPLIGVCFHIK